MSAEIPSPQPTGELPSVQPTEAAELAETAAGLSQVDRMTIPPPPGGWPEASIPETPPVRFGDVVPVEPRTLEGASSTPEELLARGTNSVSPGSVNVSPQQLEAALSRPPVSQGETPENGPSN